MIIKIWSSVGTKHIRIDMIRACGSKIVWVDGGRKICPCNMIRACGSQWRHLKKVSTIFNHYLKHAKFLHKTMHSPVGWYSRIQFKPPQADKPAGLRRFKHIFFVSFTLQYNFYLLPWIYIQACATAEYRLKLTGIRRRIAFLVLRLLTGRQVL